MRGNAHVRFGGRGRGTLLPERQQGALSPTQQIQALNRFQPILPMMPATPERRSNDYVRHGTTSLFAALDMASGKVIGSLRQHHRATEFKKFLVQIDTEVPAKLQVHLILDNYATHKTPEIVAGCSATPASKSTPLRRRGRGSTWSSAGSASSPRTRSSALRTRV